MPLLEDEFTRASEKRKLASKLTHFGTLDSHHRVKKVKLNINQAQKLPQVSSSTLAKLQPREHSVVMETPMVNRRELFSETPVVPQENGEVESPLKVPGVGFGFGTPSRVARQHQPTARKRRLLLGNHKKPPGRGLPRIALEVMKAKRELQKTMTEREYRSFGPGSFLEEEELHTFTDDAGAADTTNFVSLSTRGREEPVALGVPEDLGRLEANCFSNHGTSSICVCWHPTCSDAHSDRKMVPVYMSECRFSTLNLCLLSWYFMSLATFQATVFMNKVTSTLSNLISVGYHSEFYIILRVSYFTQITEVYKRVHTAKYDIT